MIPLQDVVPSGQLPLATLALVLLNLLAFALHTLHFSVPMAGMFVHASLTSWIAALWCLWLFGDNVEARLGRITLLAIYVASGVAATFVPGLVGLPPPPEGVGSAGAVTGILGAYFVLLPQSRILLLVPARPALVEVPATFFFGLWWILQFLAFGVGPSLRLLPGAGVAIWALATALVTGAAVGWARRPPIIWR